MRYLKKDIVKGMFPTGGDCPTVIRDDPDDDDEAVHEANLRDIKARIEAATERLNELRRAVLARRR